MHCAGEAGSIHAPPCERWEGDWFRQMCQPHLTDGTLTSLAASGAKPTVRISFVNWKVSCPHPMMNILARVPSGPRGDVAAIPCR